MDNDIKLNIVDPKLEGIAEEEQKLKELQQTFNPDDDRYVFEFRGVITDSDQKLKFMSGIKIINGKEYALVCAPPIMEEISSDEISFLSRGKSNDSETPDNPLIWRFNQEDLDLIQSVGVEEASKQSR